MQVPDWLVPVLQQFPIVVLVVLVSSATAWGVIKYANRWLETSLRIQNESTMLLLKEKNEEIKRVREDREQAERAHAAELERLTKQLQAEIDRLRKENTGLRGQITRLRNQLESHGEEGVE